MVPKSMLRISLFLWPMMNLFLLQPQLGKHLPTQSPWWIGGCLHKFLTTMPGQKVAPREEGKKIGKVAWNGGTTGGP